MPEKILVLSGGFSAEREVSLVSGKGVAQALRECGYDVVEHDLTSAYKLLEALQAEKPDAVFNALHGNWGEDGEIQGFLDMLQIPYTHSGLAASFLGMNKLLTKEICRLNGIKTADYRTLTYGEFKKRGTFMGFPYVLKPQSDGSSVGVFIVKNKKDESKVCYDDEACELLAEKYIAGKELTVAVIDGKACGVTELRPVKGFYDYKAKYTNGATMHILPAEIDERTAKTAMEYAEKIHKLLGCNTLSRSDFRYNDEDGVVFLEINTNPGMTPLSLVPEQAKYAGISYPELCKKLVEKAACRKIK